MENLKPRSYRETDNFRISKYRGTCRWCGELYMPLAHVNWNPRVKGTVCHAECYAQYGSPTPKPYMPYDPNAINREHGIPEKRGLDVGKAKVEDDYLPLPVDIDTPEVTPYHDVAINPKPQVGNSPLGQTLADAIAPYLDSRLKGIVTEEQVKAIVEKLFDSMVFKQVHVVEYVRENEIAVNLGVQHKQFDILLRACQVRRRDGHHINVWMTGPAGTGKTTAAMAVAKAMGLEFYTVGSLDNEYKLMGFVDAQGRVINTAFKDAFTKGGVFLYDECDGSLPQALLPFNQALANTECAFPDGVYPRHKDFICIAAANTWGLGATNDYVGRCRLDAAFLDRFQAKIYWGEDETLEQVLAGNDEWVKAVQGWRRNARTKGLKVVISPRMSLEGAAMLAQGLTLEEVTQLTIKANLTEEQWKNINQATPAVAGGRY